MINELNEKISAQQKGKKHTAVWGVGEDLKKICRDTPGAAEYTKLRESISKTLTKIAEEI